MIEKLGEVHRAPYVEEPTVNFDAQVSDSSTWPCRVSVWGLRGGLVKVVCFLLTMASLNLGPAPGSQG